MLATTSVHELLEASKTNKILCGRLLPTNNNKAFVDNGSIYTVTVVEDAQDMKPIAFGAFQVCSKNQAYFILHECDPKYINKNIAVKKIAVEDEKKPTSHCCLKIVQTENEPEVDFSFLPQYYGAFGERRRQPALVHIYDTLIKMTIEGYNMDVSKNITVDLYNFEEFNNEKKVELRDRLGMLVSNDCLLYEITIERSVLEQLLSKKEEEAINVQFEEICRKNAEFVFDYDSTTSLYNRQNHLEYLLKIKEIKGVIAFEAGQPVGYTLGLNNRILQCYAETDAIARGLVKKVTEKLSTDTMSMFVKEDCSWVAENYLAKTVHVGQVQRYHSRVVPSHIKWPNVFIVNIGLSLY